MVNVDFLKTLFWYIIFLVSIYYLPDIISALVAIVFLYSFYKSGDDYIHLAVLFIIISDPGRIFTSRTEDIISFMGFGISLAELFSAVALVKLYNLRNISNNFFKNAYLIYFIYLLFLIVYGLLEGMSITGTEGYGFGRYRATIKLLLLIPLYFTIPNILYDKSTLIRFGKILFVFIIINFMLQLIWIITGIPVLGYLNPESLETYRSREFIRATYGFFLSFITLTLSIYFIATRSLDRRYMFAIMAVSVMVVIISGTRGWMLAYLFISIISFLLISQFNIFKIIRTFAVIFLIIILLIQVDFIRVQLEKSFERFSTMEHILEGDPTSGGTVSRLTDRHEQVIIKFKERPIIGWGFSSTAHIAYDQHVGNQSMLMAGGVVGYILFLITIGIIIKKIILCKILYSTDDIDASNLYIFIICIGGLFIIHSSSTDLFSYLAPTMGYHYVKIIFLAVFFSIVNAILVDIENVNQSEEE